MKQAIYALAMLASASSASAANLVVNGGFETGDFTGWGRSGELNFGEVTLNPQYVNSGLYGATFANRLAFTHLTQAISTTAGHNYAVSFFVSNDNFGQPANSFFRLEFGGLTMFQLIDAADFSYTQINLNWIAAGTSALLDFTSLHPPGLFALDDVDITDLGPVGGGVPEPASWAMLIAGFGMVGIASRRRMRTVAG